MSPFVDDMRDMALSSDQSRSIAAWSAAEDTPGAPVKGPGALISAAAIPTAADVAVVAYYDHSVRVWELEASAGEELTAHDNSVAAIVVEDELAVTIDTGNIVLFWSLSTGRPVNQGETRFAEESLDGLIELFGQREAQPDEPAGFGSHRWISSAGGKRAVRYEVSTLKLSEEPDPADPGPEGPPLPFEVWNLDAEGRLVERLHEADDSGRDSRLTQVIVSADGRKAVAAGWGSLRVFDLELGRQLFRLTGHTGPVWDVALADGGRLALSASEDATVRLWEVETGLCVTTFTGESPMRVCEATMLPGHPTPTLIAGEDSGRVHILRLWPATNSGGRALPIFTTLPP